MRPLVALLGLAAAGAALLYYEKKIVKGGAGPSSSPSPSPSPSASSSSSPAAAPSSPSTPTTTAATRAPAGSLLTPGQVFAQAPSVQPGTTLPSALHEH